MTVHALLVGINQYRSTDLGALEGCLNDVGDAAEFLHGRVHGHRTLRLTTLRNGEATKAAVTGHLREFLTAAVPDDVVLFWFSGHGSVGPVPDELRHLEPDGFSQALVCVDSRCDGVTDLFDYELAALINTVPDAGVHVAVVLDSCHSAGATRAPTGQLVARWAPPLGEAPALASLVPEIRSLTATRGVLPATPGDRGRHVALAACQNHQQARETDDPDRRTGVFSAALLRAAKRLGESASYRELMVAARTSVENLVQLQTPALSPAELDIVDQPFLGGVPSRSAVSTVLRYVDPYWEVNVGACHGLPPVDGGQIRFGVQGGEPDHEAQVVRVRATSSQVTPIGWAPDPEEQYRVVVTSVPIPRVTMSIHAPEQGIADRIAAAVRTAAPGGQPSQHLELLAAGDPRAATLQVVVSTDGSVDIRSADGAPLAATADSDAPAAITADLEHIARWWRLRDLAQPIASTLAGAVELELVPTLADEPPETIVDYTRPALRPGPDGAYRLEYVRRPWGWEPPGVFIRLRNTLDRRLYCVLLDLTDRYGVDPDLFHGQFVGAGVTAAVNQGGMLEFRLPPGRAVEAGAEVRDWLKLVVTEQLLESEPFRMGPLGAPGVRRRSTHGLSGIFGRLAAEVLYRDGHPRLRAAPADWSTTTVEVVTRVPLA